LAFFHGGSSGLVLARFGNDRHDVRDGKGVQNRKDFIKPASGRQAGLIGFDALLGGEPLRPAVRAWVLRFPSHLVLEVLMPEDRLARAGPTPT
jgi:hypothetical protein